MRMGVRGRLKTPRGAVPRPEATDDGLKSFVVGSLARAAGLVAHALASSQVSCRCTPRSCRTGFA